MKTTVVLLFAVFFLAVLLGACGGGRMTSRLIGAARSGDVAAVQTLLRGGADANETGGVNGWTALQHAIHKNQTGTVAALLDGGADPNARGGGRMTPLMMAAGYGQEEIVRILLRKGADPRLRDPQGEAAVDLALSGTTDIDRFTAGRCQAGTVKVLLEAAPDTQPAKNAVSKVFSFVQSKSGCAELRAVLTERR
ncbi:MAG TPA: ankyrin repeat domain-containing protein [Paludibaculum sp.]|jgi:hypothetical protein